MIGFLLRIIGEIVELDGWFYLVLLVEDLILYFEIVDFFICYIFSFVEIYMMR